VVLDTAHNVASIEALVTTLQDRFPTERRTLIFAASRDKDVTGMLRRLLPAFDEVVFTQFCENPRAATVEALQYTAHELLASQPESRRACITACDNPALAWQYCRQRATDSDVICIAGSFFLAAEIRPLLESK
jgi:dihydrofolate synthase/folylpolyglutamate synthase